MQFALQLPRRAWHPLKEIFALDRDLLDAESFQQVRGQLDRPVSRSDLSIDRARSFLFPRLRSE